MIANEPPTGALEINEGMQSRRAFLSALSAAGAAAVMPRLAPAAVETTPPAVGRPSDLCRATATQLAQLIRRREVSSLEVVNALLARIAQVNPRLNAIVLLDAEGASVTGWPAAVVRAGTSSQGLPLGLQVIGRPWREDVVLALVGAIERAWPPPP